MSTPQGIKFWSLLLIALSLAACQADNVDEAEAKLSKPPDFNSTPPREHSIPENTTFVWTFTASQSNYDKLKFSLGGKDAKYFNIGEYSGDLEFKTAPNFEDLPLPVVGVVGKDDEIGNKGKATNPFLVTIIVTSRYPSSASFDLAVTIINDTRNPEDTPPVIDVTSISGLTIVENTDGLVTWILATDADVNDSLTLTLRGDDTGMFSLDEKSGHLSFKTPPNFEGPLDANRDNVYALTVSVTDTVVSISKEFTVSVTNCNDPPVLSTSSALSLAENTTFVSTIQVTDEDKDPLILEIQGGADATKFVLINGSLSFKLPPDFEVATDANQDNIYEVGVVASDGVVDSQIKLLRVTVLNVVEDYEFNTATTAYSIPENTSAIGNFTATDPNGGAITYRLIGADAALFSYANGVLGFISAPDYERPTSANADNVYHVTISATNTSQVTLSSDLTINVTDVTAGDLDSTFGPDGQGGFRGYVTYNLPGNRVSGVGSHDGGQSVLWTSDGKIVVAGYINGESANGYDMAVWRLNADGSLDTHPNSGFGLAPAVGADRPGFMIYPRNGDDFGRSVALLPPDATGNAKIVVAGSGFDGGANGEYMAVWRLNTDGSLDTDRVSGFGPAPTIDAERPGFVSYPNATGTAIGHSLALLLDDTGTAKIVVAGSSFGEMAVWRLNTDGSIDTSFAGGDGIFTHDNAAGGNGDDSGYSLNLLPDARIVVAGSSWGGATNGFDLAVWRLTDTGSLDLSFGGGDGVFTHHNAAGGYGKDEGRSLALLPDTSIVVAGDSWGGATNFGDLAVWRLTDTGSLDLSFGGGDGIFTHHNAAGGNSMEYGYSLKLLPDARIVVAGSSWGGTANGDYMAVWQLTATGNLDTSFGVSGIFTHHNAAGGNAWDVGYSLALLPPGTTGNAKIVVVGESYGGYSNGSDLAVWVLNQ